MEQHAGDAFAMSDRQFRFAYFTRRYDETVAFYRDGLGLPVSHAWDRSPDDRGTLIGGDTAASACGNPTD